MDMYLPEILFGGFMLLLLLGAPITVALGGAAMGAYVVLDKDPIALVQIAFTSVSSFPLMALPAFVLAGALMEPAFHGVWSILPKHWPARSRAGWARPRCWLACSLVPSRARARPPLRRWAC